MKETAKLNGLLFKRSVGINKSASLLKRADATTAWGDVARSLPSALVLGPLDTYAQSIGSLSGLISEPPTVEEMKARTEGIGFIPGVSGYRLAQRRTGVSRAVGAGRGKAIHERVGGLTSTILSAAAGSVAGAHIASPYYDYEGMWSGAAVGAGLPHLIAGLAAAITRRRTLEEQKAYENSGGATALNYLLPGYSTYQGLKALGVSNGLTEGKSDEDKKDAEKKGKLTKTSSAIRKIAADFDLNTHSWWMAPAAVGAGAALLGEKKNRLRNLILGSLTGLAGRAAYGAYNTITEGARKERQRAKDERELYDLAVKAEESSRAHGTPGYAREMLVDPTKVKERNARNLFFGILPNGLRRDFITGSPTAAENALNNRIRDIRGTNYTGLYPAKKNNTITEGARKERQRVKDENELHDLAVKAEESILAHSTPGYATAMLIDPTKMNEWNARRLSYGILPNDLGKDFITGDPTEAENALNNRIREIRGPNYTGLYPAKKNK